MKFMHEKADIVSQLEDPGIKITLSESLVKESPSSKSTVHSLPCEEVGAWMCHHVPKHDRYGLAVRTTWADGDAPKLGNNPLTPD